MTSKISILISFFFVFYNANAFNITNLLGQYPDFSTFNSYLTQTQLAAEINSRQTITVLAVDNANISPLSGKPVDVLRKIMSLHIVLDYFDVQKLQNLQNKTTVLTTLFQASGQAVGQKGFLNVTDLSGGSVAFGSAGTGAALGANLVKSIVAEPYNISILQISSVIVPVGTDNSSANSSSNSTSPSSPPTAVPAVSPTTSPTPAISPAKSPSTPPPTPAESPSVPSPAPDISPSMSPPMPSDAPAPSDAPSDATAPAEADTPDTTPSSPPQPTPDSPPQPAPGSPPMPDAPTANAPAADAPADTSAGTGATLQFNLRVLMIVVPSAMCFLLVV